MTENEQRNILMPDQPSPASDDTAGHSKGNWYWHHSGETFIGIRTNCQHPYDNIVGYPLCHHEHDIIIPGTNDGEFEELMDAICDDSIDFDQYCCNLRLMALAQHAPHDCGDPECPGVINKRKLELYDRFQDCINGFAEAGLLE